MVKSHKITQLYETLYTIDFNTENFDKIFIELSFTFLNWKLAESLSHGHNSSYSYDINHLNPKVVKMLCLNIFPQGNTILHYLYNQPDEIVNLYKAVAMLADKDPVPFQVPFIKNFAGESPLHKCLKEQNL